MFYISASNVIINNLIFGNGSASDGAALYVDESANNLI